MSPLLHRIPRELKNSFGKYAGIFALIAFTISFVGGFLTTANSIQTLLDDLPEQANMEDGRLTVNGKLTDSQVRAAEKGEFSWIDKLAMALGDESVDANDYRPVTLFPLFCRNVTLSIPDDPIELEHDITLRLYTERTNVDIQCVHEGSLPTAADEVAVDVTFARNHELSVGDAVEFAGRTFTVSGLVTLPDYTTLFETNSGLIMDDLTFCVGIVSQEAYDALAEEGETFTYVFQFDDPDLGLADRTRAEGQLAALLSLSGASITDLIDKDANQGIMYVADDVEGDSGMYKVFMYLIIIIMAVLFVIITGATIERESSTIGTLLASGYGKGELLRHYMALPMIVSLLAAAAGNLFGQDAFANWGSRMYYNSYSLPPFRIVPSQDAFILTTVVPLVILFLITLVGLARKLRATPLAFLRHEIRHTRKGAGIPLPAAWPFGTRFRLRVLIDNAGSFLTMFLGISFSGLLLIFGLGMLPAVQHIAELSAQALPAEHVYLLKSELEIVEQDAAAVDQAEKLEAVTLQVPKKWGWGPLDATCYGIEEDSIYWPEVDVSNGGVVLGMGLAQKTGLGVGDRLELTNPYEDESYAVTVSGVSGNVTDMNIYFSRATLNGLLDNDDDAFNGWVSNEELHFPKTKLAQEITSADMSKMAEQMEESMGEVMSMIALISLVIFLIVVYLLSKTVMERSSRAVSQLKVFGYRNGEVSSLYSRAVTICVAASLLLSIPLILGALDPLVELAMMKYDANFPISLPMTVYLEYLGSGLGCYLLVALLNKLHLNRIPLSLALKSQE